MEKQIQATKGYLQYSDALGAYEFPISNRARLRLVTLEKKEQEIRSLEIDLFTGDVYYQVDNEDSTSFIYYYDMTSKKASRNGIQRYIRSIKDPDLLPSAQERAVLSNLPGADWESQLCRIPAWKEAYENRLNRLLLPHIPAESIEVSNSIVCPVDRITEVTFLEKSHKHSSVWSYTFYLCRDRESTVLRYVNENEGAIFLKEDAMYERVLTEKELNWFYSELSHLLSDSDHKKEETDSKVCFSLNETQPQYHAFHTTFVQFLRRELNIL